MVEEGLMVSSPDDSSFRKARRAYLSSYGRTVERFRQADHCIGCGQCNPHCPQGIDIPKELRKIDKYVEGLKTNTV
jgi:predicted aldo/keto reductase-like oxidoreductase